MLTTCSACRATLKVSSVHLTVTATRPSNGVRGKNHVPAHKVTSDAYVTDETGEDVIYWDCPLCEHADSLDLTD